MEDTKNFPTMIIPHGTEIAVNEQGQLSIRTPGNLVIQNSGVYSVIESGSGSVRIDPKSRSRRSRWKPPTRASSPASSPPGGSTPTRSFSRRAPRPTSCCRSRRPSSSTETPVWWATSHPRRSSTSCSGDSAGSCGISPTGSSRVTIERRAAEIRTRARRPGGRDRRSRRCRPRRPIGRDRSASAGKRCWPWSRSSSSASSPATVGGAGQQALEELLGLVRSGNHDALSARPTPASSTQVGETLERPEKGRRDARSAVRLGLSAPTPARLPQPGARWYSAAAFSRSDRDNLLTGETTAEVAAIDGGKPMEEGCDDRNPAGHRSTTNMSPPAAAWSSSPATSCRCSTPRSSEEHTAVTNPGRSLRRLAHGRDLHHRARRLRLRPAGVVQRPLRR